MEKEIIGHLHPITLFLDKSIEIFQKIGFEVVEGAEIETEKYNFDLLNISPEHPARDLQDTFWLKGGQLLRTHTSPVQIRAMQKRKPPVRIISPGRVFRHEATDANHESQFYQLEGFAIDQNITMGNLIWTIEYFLREMFGRKIVYRIYPHYYPFVEPGMDVAIKVKSDKWLEVLGAGMIHPNVLKNMNVSPEKYSGFAFGMGIDRLMMLQFGVDDIRLSYGGDLRFLKQF